MMVNGEFVQKDVLKKKVRIDSLISKMQFECLDNSYIYPMINPRQNQSYEIF